MGLHYIMHCDDKKQSSAGLRITFDSHVIQITLCRMLDNSNIYLEEHWVIYLDSWNSLDMVSL